MYIVYFRMNIFFAEYCAPRLENNLRKFLIRVSFVIGYKHAYQQTFISAVSVNTYNYRELEAVCAADPPKSGWNLVCGCGFTQSRRKNFFHGIVYCLVVGLLCCSAQAFALFYWTSKVVKLLKYMYFHFVLLVVSISNIEHIQLGYSVEKNARGFILWKNKIQYTNISLLYDCDCIIYYF